MRISIGALLSFFLLFVALTCRAQLDIKKVCRLEDGRLVFTLDSRWNQAQRREVSHLYALDSALLADAFALKPVISEKNNNWVTRKVDDRFVELSKEQRKPAAGETARNKIFLIDDKSVDLSVVQERESVPFGVNRLTRNTIMQLPGGRVRFFLPGHRQSQSVCISGSFNGWSTRQTPLIRNDSGWVITLKLQPGKYAYKYIVDGKWTNDSFNKLHEADTYGGINNIFFCYNHLFELGGHEKAARVVVAGSFNNWKPDELRMIRIQGTWMLSLYLREGTHAYKFIVDQQWITDPANKVTRPDGKGNRNSFLGVGDTLYFRLTGFTGAKRVAVGGNFNLWNDGELFMEKTESGWQLPYVLAAGNYEYKFVIDGKWITDPANPYISGGGDYTNSILVVKPNHVFRLEKNANAKKVLLSGSFNGWSKPGYRMAAENGVWTLPLYLKPGKYTYKFVVDDKWILDPSNELWENNEFGTGNSVLWIENAVR
ncbi:MAG: glycogen-binding domain-containing protein [Bacteroidota bacterium]